MEAIDTVPGQVLRLPLEFVMPDPNNPRKDFDEDALQDLAEDIKLRGVEQPITVYPIGAGFFRIKLGERRYRASKLAGMDTIPALVATDNPEEAPELDRLLDQVKENCLRKDLTPIEWGLFFKRLREDFHLQVKEIPDMLEQRGMKRISRSYISNFMRLTELPEWAIEMISSGTIPASYGKHLLVACESPLVAEHVRGVLGLKADEYEAIHSETELQAEIANAYQLLHPRLDRRCTTWDAKQPLYKASELTDEDREALGVRTIAGAEFILNLEEHERRQQAARDAGAKPARHSFVDEDDGEESADSEGASPVPEARSAAKKEVLPSTDKVSEYLTAWLRQHIIGTVFDLQRGGKAAAEELARRLVSWAAFAMPTARTYADHMLTTDDGPGLLLRATAQELGLPTLGDFLTDNIDPSHKYERAARALLERMQTDNLMQVVVWLGIELQEVYQVDAAYLALHTGAGLEKLAKDCHVRVYDLPQKVADIRAAYLDRADQFGTPPQLQKVWDARFRDSRQLATFCASLKRASETTTMTDAAPAKPGRKRKAKTEASADAA